MKAELHVLRHCVQPGTLQKNSQQGWYRPVTPAKHAEFLESLDRQNKVISLFSVVHAHLHLEIPFNIGDSSIITEDKCFANNADLSSIILPEKSKQYFQNAKSRCHLQN